MYVPEDQQTRIREKTECNPEETSRTPQSKRNTAATPQKGWEWQRRRVRGGGGRETRLRAGEQQMKAPVVFTKRPSKRPQCRPIRPMRAPVRCVLWQVKTAAQQAHREARAWAGAQSSFPDLRWAMDGPQQCPRPQWLVTPPRCARAGLPRAHIDLAVLGPARGASSIQHRGHPGGQRARAH